ncbi:MAG: toll/interleukin-1 receptor domain-containing protein [Bacteroidia bacterium]|nr:toll/interleukin-1 receptor domain-containing protein [Bacteroidia bacterium]
MIDYHKLISENRIDEALTSLLDLANEKGQLTQAVSKLQRDYTELKTNQILGILSREQIRVESAQVINSIMQTYEFLYKETTSPKDIKTQKSKHKIYFSYSWKDDKEREGFSPEEIENRKNLEIVVDKLYNDLERDGYQLVRDKVDLAYGESILEFMKDMGEGGLILVFISDKYVRSDYSMFELFEIARNNKWEEELVRSRILPINLENLRFNTPQSMRKYLTHWKALEKEWEELYIENLTALGIRRNYEKVANIKGKLTTLLDWLSDWNSMTIPLLSEENFQKVKETIDKRLKILD